MGRLKLSEEEKKQRNRERCAKWRANHPDNVREIRAKWRAKNPELSRANILVSGYQQSDKKQNRGECTITPIWIVYNIFPMPCHYCGAMGWEIMGCDRIDNSLPHTPDNVVPCCAKCNWKRHLKSYEEFVEENIQ